MFNPAEHVVFFTVKAQSRREKRSEETDAF